MVYIGRWNNDKMDGEGILTHKVTLPDGSVRWNQIQKGTFQAGVFQSGYDVIHAVADPDYSFTYKKGKESLEIMGFNRNMKQAWAAGTMFSVHYKNGNINKNLRSSLPTRRLNSVKMTPRFVISRAFKAK